MYPHVSARRLVLSAYKEYTLHMTFIEAHELTTLGHLVVATLLGAVIGFERERSGKIAGLRTHTLVALGSCLFTVISVLLYNRLPSINGVQGYDYHLVANIIVGIGFIGAGAIMRRDDKVIGTTTAASLWITSAVGMATGFGFYREALASTVLVYGVLTGLWEAQKRMTKSPYFHKNHQDLNGSSML